jgi:hypothetical protein
LPASRLQHPDAYDVFVVASVGLEAQVKPRDFARALQDAEQRLKELEEVDE